MSTSLVKFFSRAKDDNGRNLYWDRAHIDGFPFRGPQAPLLPEDEYEARVTRVADARNEFFDVTNPEQNKAYLTVLDCWANGWYQVLHIERFWHGTTKHYVEWVEYYLEDGNRTPYVPHGVMNMNVNGS